MTLPSPYRDLRRVAGIAKGKARQVLIVPAGAEDETARIIKRITEKQGQNLRRLRNVFRDGSRRKRAYAISDALNCKAALADCIIVAAAKRGRRMTLAQVMALADNLNPWLPCREKIRVVRQQKPDLSWRYVADFGIQRLALNYLVRNILLAVWGTPPNDFNLNGQGTHGAVRFVRDLIGDCNSWVYVADIKSFFPSIRHDVVMKMLCMLPERVIANCILVHPDVDIAVPPHFGDSVSIKENLRRGVPQGAPTSSLIAGHLLEEVLRPVAIEYACGWYTDNFFGCCVMQHEAEAMITKLRIALKTHPDGGLTLHKEELIDSDDGVPLLGYLVTSGPSKEWDHYRAWAFPSPKARKNWLEELPGILSNVPPVGMVDDAIERAESWLKSSFPLCDPSTTWRETFYNQVAEVADGVAKATPPKAVYVGTAAPWVD